MKRLLLHTFLLIILVNFSYSCADNDDTETFPPKSVLERAKLLKPGATLEHIETSKQAGGEIMWSYYRVTLVSSYPEYVYVLWNPKTLIPFWGFIEYGGPVDPSWLDFNNDGIQDFFYFSGDEQYFSTSLYIRNGTNTDFSTDNFLLVYFNDSEYSVIVDMDQDEQPEILFKKITIEEEMGNGILYCERDVGDRTWSPPLIVPERFEDEVMTEYYRMVGTFEQYNFDAGNKKFYAIHNVGVFSEIKILRITNNKLDDVTKQYPRHLEWRRKMLKKVRGDFDFSKECLSIIDAGVSYLSKIIQK